MKRNAAYVNGLVCLIVLVCLVTGARAAVTMRGTLLSVNEAKGVVRLQTGAGAVAIKPDAAAKIMRGQLGKELRAAILRELAPGDHIVAVVNQKNAATSIKAFYSKAQGTFAKLAGMKLFFKSGKMVMLADTAQIVLPNGKIGHAADLKPGSILICRTNPVTNRAWTVVSTGSEPAAVATKPLIRSVTYSAPTPLKAGDTITADLSGTPGGRATFEIKHLIAPTVMKEVAPGKYHAVATVPKGKSTLNAPLVGRLMVKGAKAAPVQAGRLVSVVTTMVAPYIETITAPPAYVDINPTPVEPAAAPEPVPTPAPAVVPTPDPVIVETAQPVAPPMYIIINSPIGGEKITKAIIVTGSAEPESRVRIRVSYNNGLSGVLKLAGDYASQDIAVGNNGEFRMGPLALDSAMSTLGLRFTIEVSYIDYPEVPSAAVTVIGSHR